MLTNQPAIQHNRPPDAQTKDLILSLATNLDFKDYSRFLLSARRFCTPETTDIVLFVNQMELEYVELANRLQVKLVPIRNFSKEASRSLPLKLFYRSVLLLLQLGAFLELKNFAQAHRASTANWIHPICSRHFSYRDYLKVNPIYRCVLLTDSRDVIFQGNPFPMVNPDVLSVFAQDRALKFGEGNLDSEWFAWVFGQSMLDVMHGKPTICAGTIMGSPTVLLNYLEMMEQEILDHQFRVIDQAVHNKLVHLKFPRELVKIYTNYSGPVLTLGETAESGFEVVENQILVNGKVIPVIHQYDRFPKLVAMLEALYSTEQAETLIMQ